MDVNAFALHMPSEGHPAEKGKNGPAVLPLVYGRRPPRSASPAQPAREVRAELDRGAPVSSKRLHPRGLVAKIPRSRRWHVAQLALR